MKAIYTLLACVLLAACASKPPAAISRIPVNNPSVAMVRMNIDDYIDSEVRWGGKIAGIENRADSTWIEIVRQPLHENGRPDSGGRSDGRFIASFDKFLDPVVYEIGRPLTVVGRIESRVTRKIGEYDYLFPIVAVEGSFLWKKLEPVPPAAYPPPWWYYDPWYYPWHPHPRRHYH